MVNNTITYKKKTSEGTVESTITLDSFKSIGSMIELPYSKLKIKLNSGTPELTYFGSATGYRGNMYLDWTSVLTGEICPSEYQGITETTPVMFRIKGRTEYFRDKGELDTKHENIRCTGINFTSEFEIKFPDVVRIIVRNIKDHPHYYDIGYAFGKAIQMKTSETSKVIDPTRWH